PCSRTTSRRTEASRSRERCGRTWAATPSGRGEAADAAGTLAPQSRALAAPSEGPLARRRAPPGARSLHGSHDPGCAHRLELTGTPRSGSVSCCALLPLARPHTLARRARVSRHPPFPFLGPLARAADLPCCAVSGR